MSEAKAELDTHINKREVVEAFNRMGAKWNQALERVYEKIAKLEGAIFMSDLTLEQRFLADEKVIDGLTRSVSIATAELQAEIQSLKDQASTNGSITADDLATLDTKLADLNGAVGGLSQLAPAQPDDNEPTSTDAGTGETPVISDNGGSGDASTDTGAPTVTQPVGDSNPEG